MAFFDIVILGLLAYGFIRGLVKGLFVEVASVVSLIAGIYGAIHFSNFIGVFLASKVSWNEKYITLVSFVLTFAVIVLVISLLGKLFTKLADFASLGMVNKILGGVFGAFKLGIIISIMLIVFNKLNTVIPLLSEEKQKETVLFQPIIKFAPTVFPNLIKVIKSKNDSAEISEPEN